MDSLQVFSSFTSDTVAVIQQVAAQHGQHIHWASNSARVAGLALWSYIVVWSSRRHI